MPFGAPKYVGSSLRAPRRMHLCVNTTFVAPLFGALKAAHFPLSTPFPVCHRRTYLRVDRSFWCAPLKSWWRIYCYLAYIGASALSLSPEQSRDYFYNFIWPVSAPALSLSIVLSTRLHVSSLFILVRGPCLLRVFCVLVLCCLFVWIGLLVFCSLFHSSS